MTWSEDMVNVFSLVKHSLATAALLVYPQAVAPTSITVDASDIAVGRILEQFINDQWRPLAFFNRQLHPPETQYSTFDHELLALYLIICHFLYFLEGRNFVAYSDHKPLTFAFTKMSDPWVPLSTTSFILHFRVYD